MVLIGMSNDNLVTDMRRGAIRSTWQAVSGSL